MATPASISVAVAGIQQIAVKAVPEDASNASAVIAAATYESAAEGTATVSSSGLVTGVAAGSTTITVKSGTLETTVAVTVTE